MKRTAAALLPALGTLLAWSGSVAAQQENNAGLGAVYRRIDLQALTGNRAHLGVCDVGGTLYVSARDPALAGNHVIYAITPAGTVSSFPQPAIHSVSAWGMRDLCTDGTCIAGASEAGVSIVTTTGALASTWGGLPVSQPITGAALSALGVLRGLCWDGSANGGNGLFFAVDHASSIVAFDRAGAVHGTWPAAGWSGYGLALDPTTGNLWIHAAPARGDLAEIDRATMQLTGRTIPAAVPGAHPGGLSEASTQAGHHAPWSTRASLVQLVQGDPDQLVVNRLHLLPGKPGWDEVRLELNVNGGPWRVGGTAYGAQDVLGLRLRDPTNVHTGLPAWVVFNLPPEAGTDGVTDLSQFLPGFGVLPEHRSRNIANVGNPTPAFTIVSWSIGPTMSLPLPPGAVSAGDLLRVQSLHLDFANMATFTSSNESWWHGGPSQQGILVEAVGGNSFNDDASRGFWRVRHLGGGRPAIRSVTLDWNASTRPGLQTAVFDIDQERMAGRHDGGNAQGANCRGTYRNGSDVSCGLDYAFGSNHRAACAVGSENAGFRFASGSAAQARDLTYQFVGNMFAAGQTFEWDCDTDGGLGVSGADMAGLAVRVLLTDGSVLTGTLAADPTNPVRAFVILP